MVSGDCHSCLKRIDIYRSQRGLWYKVTVTLTCRAQLSIEYSGIVACGIN